MSRSQTLNHREYSPSQDSRAYIRAFRSLFGWAAVSFVTLGVLSVLSVTV